MSETVDHTSFVFLSFLFSILVALFNLKHDCVYANADRLYLHEINVQTKEVYLSKSYELTQKR